MTLQKQLPKIGDKVRITDEFCETPGEFDRARDSNKDIACGRVFTVITTSSEGLDGLNVKLKVNGRYDTWWVNAKICGSALSTQEQVISKITMLEKRFNNRSK